MLIQHMSTSLEPIDAAIPVHTEQRVLCSFVKMENLSANAYPN